MEAPKPPVPPIPASAAPPRRWMRWVLIGSLTLNFLFIGMVFGAAYKFRGDGPRVMELSLGPFARALSDEDRRVIMRDLMQNDAARLPPRSERDAAMMELVIALRAEPFTLDQLRSLLDDQKDWVMNAQSAAQDAVLVRVGGMTTEERAVFADRLEEEIANGEDFDDKHD